MYYLSSLCICYCYISLPQSLVTVAFLFPFPYRTGNNLPDPVRKPNVTEPVFWRLSEMFLFARY